MSTGEAEEPVHPNASDRSDGADATVGPATARGRVLGLDLGRRRIGVAVCDDDRTVATPLTTVNRVGDRPVEHGEIAALVAETGATMIVVGLPTSLDGATGPAARAVLSEVRALRKLGVPVETWDERFTTVTGSDRLSEVGLSARDQRPVIDRTAAAVLLQDWIDGPRHRIDDQEP